MVLPPNCSELGLVRAHPGAFPGSLEALLDLFQKYIWGEVNKYVLDLMDWSFRNLSVKGLLIKMVQTRLEHLFCGSVWIKMHRQTSLAAPLYGEKTGGKGSKLIPDVWIITGTLRDKLVPLYNSFFCFSHLPLETEKVFESVCGCSWTVGIFTPRLIRVHLLFIWDFFPLHIIYLWCQQRFPGARRFSNTVGVGRTKLPHANGEREELMDQSQNNSKPSCCWQRVTELPGIYSKCCFSSFLSSSAAHINRMHDFLRQHFKYFSYFLLFHFAFPIFVCVSKLGFGFFQGELWGVNKGYWIGPPGKGNWRKMK